MKLIVLIIYALVYITVPAFALSYTGIDTINLLSEKDIVYGYFSKNMHNDNGSNKNINELVMIENSIIYCDKLLNDNYSIKRYDLSIVDLIKLNETVKINNKVTSLKNDYFYYNYNATGNNNAPVPESGTMVLLGFCLLGLAVYSKRRINKDS